MQYVVCHVAEKGSSAIQFDSVEIALWKLSYSVWQCWNRIMEAQLFSLTVLKLHYGSSAIQFDSVEIALWKLSYSVWQCWNPIYFSFILLAEIITYEGGEETGEPGGNPWQEASENDTY